MPTTQVILTRHAEKGPGDDPGLTEAGRRRATRLGELLKHIDHPLTAVFTSSARRTIETGDGAIAASGASVVASREDDPAAIARAISARAPAQDDVVLVVHHADTLGDVAKGLRAAASPPAIGDAEFDHLWCVAIGAREGDRFGRYPPGDDAGATEDAADDEEPDVPPEFKNEHQWVSRTYAPAKVVTLKSAGNGDRPVFGIIPQPFDPAQPFKVQTHYHGQGSSAQGGPHVARVKALVSAGTLVVLPESRDMATQRWSNVTDQAQTTRDAEAKAKAAVGATAWNVSERHLSMHSAGGDVLRRMAKDNPSGLQADHAQLLDCLYNNDGLTKAGYPLVSDATVTVVKAMASTSFIYRRFENADLEASTVDGTKRKRGEVIQEQVGADRFRIFDGAPGAGNSGKPGYPSSHDDAARYLGDITTGV